MRKSIDERSGSLIGADHAANRSLAAASRPSDLTASPTRIANAAAEQRVAAGSMAESGVLKTPLPL
jgi:hypothetical protein